MLFALYSVSDLRNRIQRFHRSKARTRNIYTILCKHSSYFSNFTVREKLGNNSIGNKYANNTKIEDLF